MAQRGMRTPHTLVVSCLCLVLVFLPYCLADSQSNDGFGDGYGNGNSNSNSNSYSNSGGNNICGHSRCYSNQQCCSSPVSGTCYDPRNFDCYHPTYWLAVICPKSFDICGLSCYDPRYFICNNGRICPKPVPTTAKPTTQKPTTPKPTTPKPTTPKPTTPKPTTVKPTTPKPTTVKPTTPKPTTPTPRPAPPPQVPFTVAPNYATKSIDIKFVPSNQPNVVYDIYRSTTTFGNTSWPGVKLIASNVNVTGYSDFNITAGTPYCYAVVARDRTTNAALTNVTSECTMLDAPITGLTCGNTGPVDSGSQITFYSMIATGSDVSYQWIVNDGGSNPIIGTGQNFTTVVFSATTTQATVIASNSQGSQDCTTDFEVR